MSEETIGLRFEATILCRYLRYEPQHFPALDQTSYK